MRIGIWTGTMAALAAATLPAHATLRISNQPTNNVSCNAGTCAATAKSANLNTADLQTLLAAGNVSVVSTSRAKNIEVRSALAWSSTHRLTLDAYSSIAIGAAVSVNGTSGLTLTTDDGDTDGGVTFSSKGSISFLDTGSSFVWNGSPCTLVADIATLAADVLTNNSGCYALARSYDAGPDGTYRAAPVGSEFLGKFWGLGNTIRNLKIKDKQNESSVGLFAFAEGPLSDVHLVHADVTGGRNALVGALAGNLVEVQNVDVSGHVSGGPGSSVGGIAGYGGFIFNSHSSATVVGNGDTTPGANYAGGLAGKSAGIDDSFSSAKVSGGAGWYIGGLAGQIDTGVERSYATGTVITGDNGVSGGLVGQQTAGQFSTGISNSYATGFAGGGVSSTVGGFIGLNDAAVRDCYSTGAVASGSGNAVGGFIGVDQGPNDLTDTYFDTETSGQSHGVGNNTNYPGVTGLTTAQFQAGLPTGFDSSVWSESATVNDGFPYLLTLPPR